MPTPLASEVTWRSKLTRLLTERDYRARVLHTRLQEKGYGLLFRSGISNIGALHLSYLPDAHYIFARYPEYRDLHRRFVRGDHHNRGDVTRLWALILNCRKTVEDGVPGDFAELGVWRGSSAATLAHFAAQSNRKAILFDTFEGFDPADLKGIDAEQRKQFGNTSTAEVWRNLEPWAENIELVKGYFPSSVKPEHAARKYAVVSLDCDLYEPIKAGLEFFYPRLSRGGLLMVHDYGTPHWEGAKLAVDEFCKAQDEFLIVLPDKCGSAFIRKSRKHGPAQPT